MRVLDSDLKVKEVSADQVWTKSRKIIWGLATNFKSLQHIHEDIEQECGLLFYSKLIHVYSMEYGVTIWKYLQVCYNRVFLKILEKEKNSFTNYSLNDFDCIEVSIDSYNWCVANMSFAELLTDEQIRILQLLLDGYGYSEIYDRMYADSHATHDKKTSCISSNAKN